MKMFAGEEQSLTPALSHPMGEGESLSVSLEVVSAGFAGPSFGKQKTPNCCSLSRRTGEGQGEGLL
jgi:hypothetical protein